MYSFQKARWTLKHQRVFKKVEGRVTMDFLTTPEDPTVLPDNTSFLGYVPQPDLASYVLL